MHQITARSVGARRTGRVPIAVELRDTRWMFRCGRAEHGHSMPCMSGWVRCRFRTSSGRARRRADARAPRRSAPACRGRSAWRGLAADRGAGAGRPRAARPAAHVVLPDHRHHHAAAMPRPDDGAVDRVGHRPDPRRSPYHDFECRSIGIIIGLPIMWLMARSSPRVFRAMAYPLVAVASSASP